MFEPGKTYSNLKILEVVDWPTRKYKVQCKCGRVFVRVINTESQLNGYCKSCRPLKDDRKNKANPESRSRLYRIWQRMKSRCDNPKDESYSTFGGKGVSYSEAWQDFNVFKEWSLNHGYTERAQLVRITNLLDFGPFNCEWSVFSQRFTDSDADAMQEFGYDPHTTFKTF